MWVYTEGSLVGMLVVWVEVSWYGTVELTRPVKRIILDRLKLLSDVELGVLYLGLTVHSRACERDDGSLIDGSRYNTIYLFGSQHGQRQLRSVWTRIPSRCRTQSIILWPDGPQQGPRSGGRPFSLMRRVVQHHIPFWKPTRVSARLILYGLKQLFDGRFSFD